MNQKLKFAFALILLALGLALNFTNILGGIIFSTLWAAGAYMIVDTFYRWPDRNVRR